MSNAVLVRAGRTNVLFDCGSMDEKVVDAKFVFITHGHTDHIGAIVSHARFGMIKTSGTTQYFIPPSCSEGNSTPMNLKSNEAFFSTLGTGVLRATEAFSDMDRGDDEDKGPITMRLNCYSPSDAPVQINDKFSVMAFPTVHRCESQGYAILRHEKGKLKKEHHGKSKEELSELRSRGEKLSDEDTTVTDFVYTGDTTFDGLLAPELSFIFQADMLLVEATYIDAKTDRVKARARGHIHLQDIIDNLSLFKNRKIVLVHLSVKYHSVGMILDTLRSIIPADEQPRFYVALRGFGSHEDITPVARDMASSKPEDDARRGLCKEVSINPGSATAAQAQKKTRFLSSDSSSSALGGGGRRGSTSATKLCKFFMEGRCLKGSECTFRHDS